MNDVAALPEVSNSDVPARAGNSRRRNFANGSPLGERLLKAGLISPEQLLSGLQEQTLRKQKLGETLVELGFVKEEDLLPFMQQSLGLPAVRLRDGLIDPQVVKLVPRARAEALSAVPMFKVRDTLTVAMVHPQNLHQVDELERLTKLKVRPVFGLQADIRRMIQRCYTAGFEVDAITADLSDNALQIDTETVQLDITDLGSISEGSPVVNLVNYVIVQAVRAGASDIHIEPGHRNSIVRFRVDGLLREVICPRRDHHPAIVSRVKVLARLDIAEHRLPQDGRMHVVVEGHDIDLRVSTLPTVLGEKVVLRVLDRHNVTFNLDKLGMPEDVLSKMKLMLNKPHGLVLVTGPTGSGKTTTLYSALELIKSVHHNIVTVEDPVEYQLELINQVQANAENSLTFANALRSILRQDPDVIMVGEIRDRETAEVAIQAALTGHLVLSTLHTNDSAGAVTRLLDMGIAGFKIAAALEGVVAQRLIRTVCSKCRTQYYPSSEILEMIHYGGDLRRQFVRGEGCDECHDTGYRGRIGIYEMLAIGRELREIIGQDSCLESIRRWHKQHGGRSLLDEGIRLAEAGKTDLDEVVRTGFFE
ncbi:MAG: Flp pilus assembly complex ATPase component TadA [Planctomycetia bacterium]|nr:Flp pilus assembly complex ATPase component TadA [Planctomycetia bacterium]